MKNLLLKFIKLYQKYYSPMRPRRCIFVPTCSQYAVEAITKYGVLKGGFLSIMRILRCNPFNKNGGYDPVKWGGYLEEYVECNCSSNGKYV